MGAMISPGQVNYDVRLDITKTNNALFSGNLRQWQAKEKKPLMNVLFFYLIVNNRNEKRIVFEPVMADQGHVWTVRYVFGSQVRIFHVFSAPCGIQFGFQMPYVEFQWLQNPDTRDLEQSFCAFISHNTPDSALQKYLIEGKLISDPSARTYFLFPSPHFLCHGPTLATTGRKY